MQVVLLAAGLGSRLGALTEKLPKALIPVAGETLLSRAVGFAGRLQPSEIVVVAGFGYLDVKAEVARQRLPVTLIENQNFREGNLLSLMAARARIKDDFLLMNVDHVYRPAVADVVRGAAGEITAFIDHDRELGPDDMKVLRDSEGRVREIAKTLTAFDCGYVGMTHVPAQVAGRYWDAAEAVLATEGRAVHVERILARLAAAARSDERPACRDISGIGWLEVDFSNERDHAEAEIAGAPASWR